MEVRAMIRRSGWRCCCLATLCLAAVTACADGSDPAAVNSTLCLAAVASCQDSDPTDPPAASSSFDETTTSTTTADTLAATSLAAELVGTWSTSTWLDASGSQQIVRGYTFSPDGRYDYTIALCRSSTDCTIQGSEQGRAETVGGVLSLVPETQSDEGPRAWPYVVGRDPNVGDLQLHLTLPDGQLDIVYWG
jgi:hypothetical protein